MKNIQMVYHHIKLHTSQTPRVPISTGRLWDHIKLHISQTRRRAGNPAVRFTTICFSNMPLNFLSSFDIQNYRLLKHIDDFTDLLPCLFTIQNYILFKQPMHFPTVFICLFTIQNYILLKLVTLLSLSTGCLFTIKNYTPLKSQNWR